MQFAFLVHPINNDMEAFRRLDADDSLRSMWGTNPIGLASRLHESVDSAMNGNGAAEPAVSVLDELRRITSATGSATEGRIYSIPMTADAILLDPDRAMAFMQEAVTEAIDWGAEVVGLGSVTGIIGGRGVFLAEHNPVAITTGNSLTVHTALQNLFRAADEFEIDLKSETVAVVGIPGSIASAMASLLAPHCGRLILVGRNRSAPARKLSERLGAELVLDIPQALQESRIILSATSTGGCIPQADLQPGSLVVDVGVPTDVAGNSPTRDDVLILTGGLVGLPEATPLDSSFLWFQHGMVPSCLAETMILALDNRPDCLSLGRSLDLEAIADIGRSAHRHGFDFSRLYSFGRPLDDSSFCNFLKTRNRRKSTSLNGKPRQRPPSAQQLAGRALASFRRHINPVMAAFGGEKAFVPTFVCGDGMHLVDEVGRRYLDFVGGFGSLNFGHNHPAIAAAVQQVLKDHAPGFAQSAVNPHAAALAERLIAVSPPGLEMAFFTNSGAESVEAALKLARAATGRPGLLSCEGSYHGKTGGALSVTGNATYQRPFEPLLPECETVPYGDYEALERALARRKFAAFIVEPIQAEGGMRVPPVGYLREAQAICRSYGTLLIVDEVQTGLGRTGTNFAIEGEDLHPDAVTLAKSLGGGLMPVGAMLTRREHWMKAYGSLQKFALHTSTFSGGSLACAAGLAALETLHQEDLAANARRRGEQLTAGLKQLCRERHCLKEVRGRGLLLGLEFQPLSPAIRSHWYSTDRSGLSQFLAPDLAPMVEAFHVVHAMQTLLHGHGIYTQAARSNPRVLRVEPPLIVSEEDVDQFLSAVSKTCEEIDFSAHLMEEMVSKTTLGELDVQRSPEPVAGSQQRIGD